MRYSRKEKEKEEKGSRVSVSKFHSLGLGNAYEPLLFDYTDFVIVLLLLLYQIFSCYILYYAFRDPLLDFTVNPREFLLTSSPASSSLNELSRV